MTYMQGLQAVTTLMVVRVEKKKLRKMYPYWGEVKSSSPALLT